MSSIISRRFYILVKTLFTAALVVGGKDAHQPLEGAAEVSVIAVSYFFRHLVDLVSAILEKIDGPVHPIVGDKVQQVAGIQHLGLDLVAVLNQSHGIGVGRAVDVGVEHGEDGVFLGCDHSMVPV